MEGFRRLAVFLALMSGLFGVFIAMNGGGQPPWIQVGRTYQDWAWIATSFVVPAAFVWVVVRLLGWVVAGFASRGKRDVSRNDLLSNQDESPSTLWNRLLLTVNVVLTVLMVGFFATRGVYYSQSAQYSPDDVIIIVLTALGVILTTLAIFLGVLGVIGFAGIRGEARRIARATAEKHFADVGTKTNPNLGPTPITENEVIPLSEEQEEGDEL